MLQNQKKPHFETKKVIPCSPDSFPFRRGTLSLSDAEGQVIKPLKIKKSLNKYKILQYPAYAGYGGSFMFLTILFQTGDPSLLIVIAGLSGVSKLIVSWRDRLIEKSKEKLKGTITQLQTIMNRRNTASERRSEPDEKISLDGRSGESEDESIRSEKTRVR